MDSWLGRCSKGWTFDLKLLRFIFIISGLVCLLMLVLYPPTNPFGVTMRKNLHALDGLFKTDSKLGDMVLRKTELADRSFWFNTSLSEEDSRMVQKALNNKYKSYLTPVTMIIANLPGISSRFRHLPEDIIRSGYGLKPFKTELGEDGWIENGIVYRPSRSQSIDAGFFTAEYESYIPFNEDLFFEGRTSNLGYKMKKIILWYSPPSYLNVIAELKPMKACPAFPCLETTNRNYFNESAAAIFGANRITSGPPQRSSPKQIFIMHNHEPQSDISIRPSWTNVFNWTFSYRLDSDIVVPYAIVRKRPKALTNKDYRSIFAQKTGLVAWAVSHCSTSSKRRKYVEELRKYISVDIIGKCGTTQCRQGIRTKCTDDIARKYKFYLGFESSFCPDYITEKIFYYLAWDIVTVVRGNDDYYLHLPSDIFINTDDFPSPEKLAKRLLYLADNETAYIEILRAKDEYTALTEDFAIYNFFEDGSAMHNDFQFHSVAMCRLCQRLWNLDRYSKTTKDMRKWLSLRSCKAPTDLNF